MHSTYTTLTACIDYKCCHYIIINVSDTFYTAPEVQQDWCSINDEYTTTVGHKYLLQYLAHNKYLTINI